MTTLIVDKIEPATGTAIQLGDSGDTITVPAGVTFTNSGTATGFGTAGLVGAKTVQYSASHAQSGANWQDIANLNLTYTAASTSNRMLFLAQVGFCISGTSCVFKFYNKTTGANPTGGVAANVSSRVGTTSRSAVNGTGWGQQCFLNAWITPPDTSANQYSVYAWDHNAGGIRINSNLNNADSTNADDGRSYSQFTILEFGSAIIT